VIFNLNVQKTHTSAQGQELGLFSAKLWKFGHFQKWFGLTYFVWLLRLFLQICRPQFGLIWMWCHIPEFKHLKCLHVHSHKHAPFLTIVVTQFNIPNPENGDS